MEHREAGGPSVEKRRGSGLHDAVDAVFPLTKSVSSLHRSVFVIVTYFFINLKPLFVNLYLTRLMLLRLRIPFAREIWLKEKHQDIINVADQHK